MFYYYYRFPHITNSHYNFRLQMKTECSICLKNLNLFCVETPCNHVFHGKCLNKWLDRPLTSNNFVVVTSEDRLKCPFCRQDMNHYFVTKGCVPYLRVDLVVCDKKALGWCDCAACKQERASELGPHWA